MAPATLTAAALTICGLTVPAPAKMPPPGSGPVVLALLLCFDKQGGVSAIEPQTYLHYIKTAPSEPSRDRWMAFDDDTRTRLREDFHRLWATNFLDDLAIEIHDYPLDAGVIGKVVVFRMEERQRIKLVEYDGLTAVSRTEIDERLKERGLQLRLDAFVDASVLRRASGALGELLDDKGHHYAEVVPEVRAAPGAPKIAHITFRVVEGPKVAIRDIEFLGNRAFSDRALAGVLKDNKPQSLLSLMSRRGAYRADAFDEDAQRIVDHYRNHGYITARVGPPVLRTLDDSADGRTRYVQLRVDVTEGARYRVGTLTFAGNALVATETLRPLFQVEPGDVYADERFKKGFERARELYGAGGYFEFTAFPELQPRAGDAAIVDVTLRITEGPQYLVNRIAITGNTTTKDAVIRRELALVEGGVFNTEALKYSVRRLNQLGYFKPLDEGGIDVQRTAGADKVDVTLAVEEQNRNQLTFGAGASQYEGPFVNFAYTSSNFLGRGESVTVALQTGTRSSTYQLSLTEPFLLDRAITGGLSLYSRKVDYAVHSATTDYSEVRSGFNLSTGLPVGRFTRLFTTYGYEVIDTAMAAALRDAFQSGDSAGFLLEAGRFTESSVTPSLVHNTVDNPFMPRSGKRFTLSAQYGGGLLGGSTQFVKPELEAILYRPLSRRTAVGVRTQLGWIATLGGRDLPYYQRYFLGGETQIRGVDLRSVGPKNSNGVAVGGTKSALFNVEYYVDLFPQVRALAFHDAGQAFGETQPFTLRQLRTSSGVELRVTLPVLNVPFRLIYAWNVWRDTTQPARTFKFAVGTTF